MTRKLTILEWRDMGEVPVPSSMLRLSHMPTVEELRDFCLDAAAKMLAQFQEVRQHCVLVRQLGSVGQVRALYLDLSQKMPTRQAALDLWPRIRGICIDMGAQMYVCVGEIWRANLPAGGNREHLPDDLGTHDLSNEAVMIHVETTSSCDVFTWPILRHKGVPSIAHDRMENIKDQWDFDSSNMLGMVHQAHLKPRAHSRPTTLPGLPN